MGVNLGKEKRWVFIYRDGATGTRPGGAVHGRLTGSGNSRC
jgi:hypothetical protein